MDELVVLSLLETATPQATCIGQVWMNGAMQAKAEAFDIQSDLAALLLSVAEHRDRSAFVHLFEYFAPRLKGFMRGRGADMPEGSLDRMLARIELPDKPSKPAATLISDIGDRSIPQPLRGYLDAAIDDLPWRRRGSISEFPLMPDASEYSTRLLLIRAGAAAPRHTHEGIELTLVLKGTFSDAHGRYQPGDIEEADSGIDHRPVAGEDEDCLCLAVTDAPLKLTSRFGRLINPFINV